MPSAVSPTGRQSSREQDAQGKRPKAGIYLEHIHTSTLDLVQVAECVVDVLIHSPTHMTIRDRK